MASLTQEEEVFLRERHTGVQQHGTYVLPEEIDVWAQRLWISLLNKPDHVIH